jgi:hypothetical protein
MLAALLGRNLYTAATAVRFQKDNFLKQTRPRHSRKDEAARAKNELASLARPEAKSI